MSGRAVVALGVTQVLGYGTLYYAFPLAVPGMAATHGIAPTTAFAAFSAGMLAAGLAAPRLGRAMDRLGAGRVMAAGSAVCALLLAALAAAPGAAAFAVLVVALEIAGAMVLYDAAFAALVQLSGPGGRRAITQLTLIAGFASTLFWPLTGWLVETVGWQGTWMVWAALHLGICLPLHLWLAAQPRAGQVAPAAAGPASPPTAHPAPRGAFGLVAVAFALSGMLVAALGVHMVPLLVALGHAGQAYLVSMVMGPAQVAIRLTDALFWKGLHPLDVALVAAAALPVAVLALLVLPGSVAAAVLFAALLGVGGGLSSIVRGTLPLSLFGAQGYGALLGRLTFVRTLLSAVAPFLFALVMQTAGSGAALAAGVALGLAGLVPLAVLRLRLRLPRQSIPGST
jgi:hypothetical protein